MKRLGVLIIVMAAALWPAAALAAPSSPALVGSDLYQWVGQGEVEVWARCSSRGDCVGK
jgi:hypothetical protein